MDDRIYLCYCGFGTFVNFMNFFFMCRCYTELDQSRSGILILFPGEFNL